jgi:hypothetical protein
MAKRKGIEVTSGEPPKSAPAKSEFANSELPTVESPSISPATPEPAIEPATEVTSVIEPVAAAPQVTPASDVAVAPTARPRFILRPRHRRGALLAASVAIAAALGALIGAVASGGFSASRTDVAMNEDRKATQQSIFHLAEEVATLKTSLDAVNKSADTQIVKINERFDHAASEELITGSISVPQTVAPVPTPRPAPRITAVQSQAPNRSLVVQGWTIRDARDGFVYVQSNGDIFQVVPGAPLPGLGPVASIKRQDGRWVVTTPKGIIVSMRDRRYFESF